MIQRAASKTTEDVDVATIITMATVLVVIVVVAAAAVVVVVVIVCWSVFLHFRTDLSEQRSFILVITSHMCQNSYYIRWEASQWEPCSTSCGEGQQTRSVHCWRLLAPGFDSSVLNQMCQHLPKPPDIRDCIATDCGPVWLLSEWSNVSLPYRKTDRQTDQCTDRHTHR